MVMMVIDGDGDGDDDDGDDYHDDDDDGDDRAISIDNVKINSSICGNDEVK